MIVILIISNTDNYSNTDNNYSNTDKNYSIDKNNTDTNFDNTVRLTVILMIVILIGYSVHYYDYIVPRARQVFFCLEPERLEREWC